MVSSAIFTRKQVKNTDYEHGFAVLVVLLRLREFSVLAIYQMLHKLSGKFHHLSNAMVEQVCFTVCC